MNLALELMEVERTPRISNNPKFQANPHLYVNELCLKRPHGVDCGWSGRDRLLRDCWDKEQGEGTGNQVFNASFLLLSSSCS